MISQAQAVIVNPIIGLGKRIFYRWFPSAFASAYIRTLYLKRFVQNITFFNVLDAGCGPGLFTLFLASRYPEARFAGHDHSKEDVERSRKEATEKGLRNVSLKFRI